MSVDDSIREAMPVEAELESFHYDFWNDSRIGIRLAGGVELTVPLFPISPELEREILSIVGRIVNERLSELGREIVITRFVEPVEDDWEDDE